MADTPIKILLIDDEPTSRKLLAAYLAKYPSFEIFEAENGRDGFKLALEKLPDIIISDYYMPLIDGIELCQKIKSVPQLASAIFLLLTVEKDVASQEKAFEHGVDDYIEKTTPPLVLTSKINAFVRLKQLQKEILVEKEKIAEAYEGLERNFRELTAILLKIVDLRVIGAADRAETAKNIARHICEKIDIPDEKKKRIIFGARVHEIGKIGLPDNLADKHMAGISPDEKTIFIQYPIIGSHIISTISGFEEASMALRHQLENYDGSGTPDARMGEEISLGARILRSIVFQEEMIKAGRPKDEILQEVRQAASKVLDPFVATSLAEFIIESDEEFSRSKQKIHIEELQPGMVIADDVYAISGVKLLPKGIVIQEHMLSVLMERNNRDPIIGGVYIEKK